METGGKKKATTTWENMTTLGRSSAANKVTQHNRENENGVV
jgi:hypothetical protein